MGKLGDMLDFVKKYSKNVYSQFGEDGIIEECIKRIDSFHTDLNIGHCVEFGAHDGKFCSNTFRLFEAGWVGTMFEMDHSLFLRLKENVKGTKAIAWHQAVTPENINLLLPQYLDVLSMDTDSDNDYYCFRAYTGTAKIVIVEINSSIQPLREYVNEGASYRSMAELGIAKGYFLLCHTGNLIFVLNEYKDLFPDIDKHPIIDHELFFNPLWLTP